MLTSTNVPIAELTTIRVGGCARRLVETDDARELCDVVRTTDEARTPLFVLGGGSNVLVSDKGFPGVVVRPRNARIEVLGQAGPDEAHEVLVRCEAGAAWDDVVAFAVSEGLEGIEALAGVPGMIGSACMQNIGAYGQEMGSALVSATLMDRATGEMRVWHADELGLGYRTSMLRRSMEGRGEGAGCGSSRGSSGQPARAWFPSPRWIVLDATLGLRRSDVGTLGHSQLAHALGVEVGTSMPVAQIRQTVLEVRAKKAMLAEGLCDAADAHDYDRWSTGSFFMNPVLSEEAAAALPADAPRYPATGGVKTSAAWLIEHAGFPRGFGVHGADSRATLSTRHCLALTNRGHAMAANVIELARHVRDGVREAFGVTLVPETVLVGCEI